MTTKNIAVGISRSKLGEPEATIAGYLKDVSNLVIDISIKRGKSSSFSSTPTSSATIAFNNQDRTFDPTVDEEKFLREPEAGESGTWNPSVYTKGRRIVQIIVGRIEYREIAGETFSVVDGREIFVGYASDWNFSYSTTGEAIAELTVYDSTGLLSNIQMDAETPVSEPSGERFENVVTTYSTSPIFPASIDDGNSTLGTQEITEGTNVSDYLSRITQTEGGFSFISRWGGQVFNQRIKSSYRTVTYLALPQRQRLLQLGPPIEVRLLPTPEPFTPPRIDMSAIQVEYGNELLYNRVELQNEGGSQVVLEDTVSQAENGTRILSLTNLLGADDTEATNLGLNIINKYSDTQLRFTEVEISFNKYNLENAGIPITVDNPVSEQQAILANTDLGHNVRVAFTPNNAGSEIVQYKQIIGIRHNITLNDYRITFSLDELSHNQLILDDPVFGKLDTNQLG